MAMSTTATTAAIAAANISTAKLGSAAIRGFEARGIGAETASKSGVYTGRSIVDDNGDSHVIPDANGDVVVFPFIDHGSVVAEKYRAKGKRFWQRKGGRRTFWNADVMDDPTLEAGHAPLTITEGEMDALTAIDCGFPFTVSVPDGAPAVQPGENPADLEPVDEEAERSGKFEFVWNNRDRLRRIKRFILALDNDAPGKRLEAELLRRLSPARCSFVTYPEGCKDLNDVRQKFGAEAVARCLNDAKPYPVRGLYSLDDYPDVQEPTTYSTGFPDLDEHLRIWLGELMIVTGIPGSGKSTWTTHLCVNLAKDHGWRTAMASFEVPTVPALRHRLRLQAMGLPPSGWSYGSVNEADRWINEHFVFIDADPTGEDDDDLTLEWIMERATDAVLRYGIRILVLDPWNEIEHARPRHESETEYHNRALRMLRRFALRYQVAVIVVAHPTKDVAREGTIRVPSLYDINGSAAWYNKPDHGVVVDVPDPHNNETVIWVKKARFRWSGQRGDVTLRYGPDTEGYSSLGGITPIWKMMADANAAGATRSKQYAK